MKKTTAITMRPYQALCLICSPGGNGTKSLSPKLKKLLAAIKKNPDIPVTLKCNTGDVFTYQDPGHADDTPGSFEFNRKRDLDILYKINMFPGVTVPARILLHRLFDNITTTTGLCGYGSKTSSAWTGCPFADSGRYEKGREKGIAAIIPPRGKKEMMRDKKKSLKAMYNAKSIRIRPHILLCSVCQIGQGIKPPYAEDNLPELLELIIKKPDTLITMAEGTDWMMCAPCPHRVPGPDFCIIHKGSGGLTNQMRDLRTLQKLGLSFESTMKGRDLFKLIFQKIKSSTDVCHIEAIPSSLWRDPCGPLTTCSPNFINGRRILKKKLHIN